MNPQQVLSQLKDIHTPQTISMWPATLAWYILFALLIILLFYLAIKTFKTQTRKLRQRKILQLLQENIVIYETNPSLCLANISILLRRIALSNHKRTEVASLSGQEWLKFLDGILKTNEFSEGIGQVLLTAPYQKSADIDIHQLADLVRRLIYV